MEISFVSSMNNKHNRFKNFLLNYRKKSEGNLECVLKQPLKKSMSSSSYRPHSIDGNNEEIDEEM